MCLRLGHVCVGAHLCFGDTYSVEVWKRGVGVCVCVRVRVCVMGICGGHLRIIYPGERKGECMLESIPQGRKIEKEEKRRQGSLQQAEQCCVTGVS